MGCSALLLVIVGSFVAVQSLSDRLFLPGFPGFLDDILGFPTKKAFDSSRDAIFNWGTQDPAFHMLAALPPYVNVPRIQVSCDEFRLNLSVGKRFGAVTLSEDELQLGNGCYSNKRFPSHFGFAYGLDQCGTTLVVQNGLEVYVNSLHFSPRGPVRSWWPVPFTVHVSCVPVRSEHLIPAALPEGGRRFALEVVTRSGTYERGQLVSLQVSAKTTGDERLFIQSCFVSASPHAQARPRHGVITNKGVLKTIRFPKQLEVKVMWFRCAALWGSHHAVARFMVSSKDVVNFVLNSSYLIPEVYVHCSVVISDQGVTSGSKSCNYNMIWSRWEELSGGVEVCDCCSSRCKGPSFQNLPHDAKATVSTGLLVILDKLGDVRPVPSASERGDASSVPLDSMQADAQVAEQPSVSGNLDGQIIPGASVSSPNSIDSPGSFTPTGVVAVRQDPDARLTVWLPGQQVQAAGAHQGNEVLFDGDVMVQLRPNDSLPPPPVSFGSTLTNEVTGAAPVSALHLLTMADGWATPRGRAPATEIKGQRDAPAQALELQLLDSWQVPPRRDNTAMAAESSAEKRVEGPETSATEVYSLLPAKKATEVSARTGERGDAAEQKETIPRPGIRSKIRFSKGADGSRSLSYEEVAPQEDEGPTGKCSWKAVRTEGPKRKRLFSVFLHLLRKLDRAE